MVDRRDLVKRHYESTDAYVDRRCMQGESAARLATLITATVRPIAEPVLDIGTGAGQLLRALVERQTAFLEHSVGVDLAEHQLRLGVRAGQKFRFVAADALHLPFPDETFGLVMSNQVLHWVVSPHNGVQLDDAVSEMCRTTARGGHVAVSTAGVGSAPLLGRVYERVTATLASVERVLPDALRKDPIGCLPLNEIVDSFRRHGVLRLAAEVVYEPVTYPDCDAYLRDVAAWGGSILTEPFPESERTSRWSEIIEGFRQLAGPGPYIHDQYINYYVGAKGDA